MRPVGLPLRRIRDYDQDRAQRSFTNLMELVAEGEVEVVPVPPKAADRAMTLVTIATRDHNIAFRVGDVLHLLMAAARATRTGSVVDLITTDTDFERFISHFRDFRSHVNPVNLGY